MRKQRTYRQYRQGKNKRRKLTGAATSLSSLASLAAAARAQEDETVKGLLRAVQHTQDPEIAQDAFEYLYALAMEQVKVRILVMCIAVGEGLDIYTIIVVPEPDLFEHPRSHQVLYLPVLSQHFDGNPVPFNLPFNQDIALVFLFRVADFLYLAPDNVSVLALADLPVQTPACQ